MQRGESRRSFLGRLGAGALGGVVSHLAKANVPWVPPPTLANPNILFIIVDQMRYTRGLTPTQMTTLQNSYMPNILGKLRNNGYCFENYYTAATSCTAARATLLTGLYAPQTGVYANQGPALSPGFPTWASAIPALNPAYQNVWWFGKWHLSVPSSASPLSPYGFQTGLYPGAMLTNPITGVPYYVPSPNGTPNEGLNGGICPAGQVNQGITLASDAMIAGDFINWLTGQSGYSAPGSPWCAVVSLINPHDITDAPGAFANPAGLGLSAWFPTDFPVVPPSGLPPALCTKGPGNWENILSPSSSNYVGNMKPSWQILFCQQNNMQCGGPVKNWAAFLNSYYWLHYYVDQQVGAVLTALNNSPFAGNTIVIFTSDHGEFGGAHGLHDKAGGVYDESIHVPLYVHFPGQTAGIVMSQMCSSVDMFGFMCDLATGGGRIWGSAYPDLAARQSLWSFIYQNAPETRQVSIAGGPPEPYILHTSDETSPGEFCPPGPTQAPDNRHIIALRTKSEGKLGYYCHWAPGTTCWDQITAPEYEFYNLYTNANELGNSYATDPLAPGYLAALGSWGPPPTGANASGVIGSELDVPLSAALQPVQAAAIQAFVAFSNPCGA